MMESREIQSILPHRWPFLLVDRIVELDPGKSAAGVKNLTGDEWFFSGGRGYPSVLLLESLAQVGGIVLGAQARQEDPRARFIGLFAGVSDFQFGRRPEIGEQLRLKVELSQKLASIYRFSAEALVKDEKIASGQILLSFSPSPEPK